LSLFRFPILCLLALVCVLVVPSGFVAFAQDEIPSTQFEAISWLENERNTVKRDANGDVVEIIIDYVPDIFVIGDLEIFPKLANLEINYTGQFEDKHMSGLAKLTNLKKFAVDYCDEISEASLSVLHYLPGLEEVRLQHCEAVFSLESLANCKSLKKLDLTNNEHLDFNALSSLVRLENLETIVLAENPGLEDQHLEWLAKIPTLRHVDLSECESVTDEGVAHLGTLNLRNLNLSECKKITGTGFAEFATPSLEELNLVDCAIDDDGLQNLAIFKNLKRFTIYNDESINGEGLAVLGNFKQLEELVLQGLPVSNEHLNLLEGIATLQRLDLSECSKISGAGLASLTQSRDLQDLKLSGCRRLDETADFEPIAQFVQLKKLDISATRIRPEAVSLLTKLSQLESLDISSCNWIDDAAIEQIAKIKTLRRLKLDDLARLTDRSLVFLAELPDLQWLYLEDNRLLTGEGFSAFPDSTGLRFLEMHGLDKLSPKGLENLPRFSKLEKLTIYSTELTNEHLLAMKGIPNLRELEMDHDSQVDDNVSQQFRASLPRLKH
jgi:F-box/leucine-rich repeat protein 14